MHEGTPIIFELDRTFSRGKRESKLGSRQKYLGVFHRRFAMKKENKNAYLTPVAIQQPMAVVYCHVDLKLHNTRLSNIVDLEDKPLDFDGVIEHDWRAWVRGAPTSLHVAEDFRVWVIRRIQIRSRVIKLTQIPATQWPKKIDEGVILSWPPQTCLLNPANDSITWKDEVQLELSNFRDGSCTITPEPASNMLRSGWVEYNPDLPEQEWQPAARKAIERTMGGYHALVQREFPRLAKALQLGGAL